MRPYYFDFDSHRTGHAVAIILFERQARRGALPPRAGRGVAAVLREAAGLVRVWRRRLQQRRDLARLDSRMLRDIGVTPSEAEREIGKPFWRG